MPEAPCLTCRTAEFCPSRLLVVRHAKEAGQVSQFGIARPRRAKIRSRVSRPLLQEPHRGYPPGHGRRTLLQWVARQVVSEPSLGQVAGTDYLQVLTSLPTREAPAHPSSSYKPVKFWLENQCQHISISDRYLQQVAVSMRVPESMSVSVSKKAFRPP